ncbi:MAG: N-6 DNA methylase, partial [Nanoarchaeota archaeon]
MLKKTAKRASLTEGKAHRKEQGIYYTPTYVVDYIVKNTIGELAKDKKFDLKNIKVLDPACGSGSFLMKAFDYLMTLDKKKSGEISQTKLDLTGASASYGRKVEILKENIFGVDLDPKAVEIAQLNLLLKTAEKKHRLPILQENIKVGNSLIDDSAVAGDRAFKWEDEFKEIMKDGGFDVVIGNPPYVEARQIEQKFVDFYRKFYKTAGNRVNTFPLFIERSINLLKEKGFFGMIIHKNSIRSNDYEKLRKFVLDKCKIVKIIPLGAGVFEGVTGEMVILIFQKY